VNLKKDLAVNMEKEGFSSAKGLGKDGRPKGRAEP
jgi:hypothetical protein